MCPQMEVTVTWCDCEILMPLRNTYVLVETPYCTYPYSVALFNGVDWIDVDTKTTVMNVRLWAYVQTPAKAHGYGGQ